MQDLGDRTEDSTIDFTFSTFDTDGAPITLAGTPAVSVYKANGTTQSTAGVTLTVDFDGVTGLHQVRLDTSADAFYATANDYSVVITTGTVDAVSVVGATLATFSIENRNFKANVTQISGDSTAADNAESFFDGTGYAGTNNVIPTVTTTTNLTNKGDGSGFTAIPWNASWDAEVQSEVSDALTAGNVMTTGDTITIDNTALDDMWSRWMNTATSDTGAGETGRAIHYLAAAFASSGVFSEAALANAPAGGGGGGSTVDADVVDDSRTWFATDNKARNIITLGDNFAGTLAMAPDLNPGTTILTVDSVSITGAATVTATGLTVNRAKTRAHFTVPALTTTGTYTVVVTVTTIDGQVIPTTATLRVQ